MSKEPPAELSHVAYASRIAALSTHLDAILLAAPIAFATMKPSQLPEIAGVYTIYTTESGPTAPYYIGRTKNLRQRLYNNHLIGPLNNARLKKYLIEAQECVDLPASKTFIRANCHARWIAISDMRERFLAECFLAAVLQPKFGLYEEH
jgi:GIY-YIG catalytic domain.